MAAVAAVAAVATVSVETAVVAVTIFLSFIFLANSNQSINLIVGSRCIKHKQNDKEIIYRTTARGN